MDLKAHASQALGLSRRMLDGMVESLSSPGEWTHQVHPTANHPLWVVGHVGLADNNFITKFQPDLEKIPEGYRELFWFGTEPSGDPAAYPPADEVLAYCHERRETLLRVLDEATDEQLNAAAPGPEERSPIAGAPNMGHAFIFAAWHEGFHTGQLSLARRALGNAPLFG